MIRACSTEIGCEPKSLKPETGKNDLHGALHCATQKEFPFGDMLLRQTANDLVAREGLDTTSKIISTKTIVCL
jgi:hypothetical protein